MNAVLHDLQGRVTRIAMVIGTCTMVVAAGACDRIKEKLNPPAGVDGQWQADSTLLASKPRVLFRVQPSDKGDRVVPMATIGEGGFRVLSFSNRGWRAFDLDYLQRGHELAVHRMGRSTASVAMQRGMWDPPTDPLDTIPGCPVIIPAALAKLESGTHIVTSVKQPALRAVGALSGGELSAELAKVPTLIAPTLGVGTSTLARFTRQVYTLETGVESRPTIVMVYDDPERLSDTAAVTAERPRHLIVILDKGTYGYRTSFRYTSAGNAKAPPRFKFLDYIDVDGDGKAELFLGVNDSRFSPLATIVLRYENEVWREILRYDGRRC